VPAFAVNAVNNKTRFYLLNRKIDVNELNLLPEHFITRAQPSLHILNTTDFDLLEQSADGVQIENHYGITAR
jgi:hypothetical protein